MNIVEYSEKVCNFHLSDWYKAFLYKVYEAVKNNGQLIYIPPRCNNPFSYNILQALAVMIVTQERGLLKEKED